MKKLCTLEIGQTELSRVETRGTKSRKGTVKRVKDRRSNILNWSPPKNRRENMEKKKYLKKIMAKKFPELTKDTNP